MDINFLPRIALPVSAAVYVPYPSIYTLLPNGITLGSTDTTFESFVNTVPFAVLFPTKEYAVASIVIVSPASFAPLSS